MTLKEFILHQTQVEFHWGVNDCALTLADWWKESRGFDPAAHLRGTYSTEDECWSVLDESGGLLRLVSDLASRAGAVRTLCPVPGDIAVVGASGLRYGAIMTPSERWFVKSVNGAVGLSDVRVLRAWSV